MTRALVGILVVLGPASALGQFNVPPPKMGETTFKDIVEAILILPQVQADIKLSQTQLQRIRLREAVGPAKQILKAMLEAKKKGEDPTSDIGTMVWGTIDFTWLSSGSVKVTDLTAAQKRRANQIAMQLSPLASLMTNEMRYGLKLTPTQEAKLEKLRKEREATSTRAFMTVMKAVVEKYRPQLGEDEVKAVQEDGGESALRMLELMEKMFPEMIIRTTAITNPSVKKTDAAALRVLTPRQRRLFSEFQGRKISV
jgi:hypothetical protein